MDGYYGFEYDPAEKNKTGGAGPEAAAQSGENAPLPFEAQSPADAGGYGAGEAEWDRVNAQTAETVPDGTAREAVPAAAAPDIYGARPQSPYLSGDQAPYGTQSQIPSPGADQAPYGAWYAAPYGVPYGGYYAGADPAQGYGAQGAGPQQPYSTGNYGPGRPVAPGTEQTSEPKKKRNGWKIAGMIVLLAVLVFATGWAVTNLVRSYQAIREQIAALQGQKQNGTPAPISDTPVLPTTGVRSDTVPILTDVSDIVEQTLPSVTAITCKTIVTQSSYFGSRQYEAVSAGSGIIIGDNGTELWIVTNNHVVDNAVSMTVTFADGTEVRAYLKGKRSDRDIAVLGVYLSEMNKETLSAVRAVTLGDSDALRLGEGVIAIGNALGWGQSVTTGIVSALNRTVTFEDNLQMTGLLQTSAAINPGNSGGALLNARGELIGINNAKYADTDVEGVGFAIPINSIKEIMSELSLMEARVPVADADAPYIGVTFRDASASFRESYDMPAGALVYRVAEGSPAEKAGLLAYDVVTKLNDAVITSYYDLTDELQYYKGGTLITLTVQRMEQGKWTEKTLTVTLGFKNSTSH